MRKYLLAGAAAFVIAAPAAATNDNSGYVGLEGGILFPKSQDVSGEVLFTNTGPVDFTQTNLGSYRYKKGLDLDFVGGYDFGMFKVEGEFGYKHAKAKGFNPGETIVTAINTGAGTTFTTASDFGLNNSASVYSAMLNGLLDFGGNGHLGGYAGGGVGYANVKQFGDSKGKLAWQLIAGVYAPVSPNIDIGLKYRFFHAGSNSASHDVPFAQGQRSADRRRNVRLFARRRNLRQQQQVHLEQPAGEPGVQLRRSCSAAAASAAATAAAAAAEAPATQTCPDGSVILATSACPAPPPPPPPPPVERGERGR